MWYGNGCGKVNVKLLIILLVVTAALGLSLVAARQIRRGILSQIDRQAGQTAFDCQDWPGVVKHYREYLGRHPDDVEILRRYAQACLSVQPLEAPTLMGAIAAYRRLIQLDPGDRTAYDKLATLYTGLGNAEELAYVARARLARDPNDRKATLWLADALIRLNKQEEARQTLERLVQELEGLAEKDVAYAGACARLGRLALRAGSDASETQAQKWFDRAVEHAPDCAESLLHRARFCRETSVEASTTSRDRLARARQDLEAADALGTPSARVRLALGQEWLAHGEWERAATELQAADRLPLETRNAEFFDTRGWVMARFAFASELTLRRGTMTEAAPLADEALALLTDNRHRMQVLPPAILLYAAAGKVPEARRCLDEYLGLLRTQGGAEGHAIDLARLQAVVARAEQRPYLVINILQPLLAIDASHPELWQLAAEAFSQTDQPRRAVAALIQYLRYHPQDAEMRRELANEYIRLRDWGKAYEVARLAESQNPSDIVVRLLRLESSIYLAAGQGRGSDQARLAAAGTELAQLRREHPEDVEIRLLQATVAILLEQPARAESELRLAIKECQEPLRAETALVRHYWRLKRTSDALDVCRTACERHGAVAEPWRVLAELYVLNGDSEAGRRCLQQGLGTVVGPWEKRSLSIRLALAELTQGERAAGIKRLRELTTPYEYEVYVRTLLLSIREVQADSALAGQLVQELRHAEGESGSWWRLHQAHLWLSSPEWRSKQQDIISTLQYCITGDPEWPAPALVLANLYEKLGDAKLMEATYRQALARNPAATDVADKLMDLLEKQGRRSDAQNVLQQVEMEPRVASAWRIRMSLRARDFSGAIDELKLRVSNDSRDANSRILLARLVYWEARDVDQAFAYLKEAEAIAPDALALVGVRTSILRAEGRGEEAQGILAEYVAKQNSFNAYSLRAAYWAREEQWERAEADYRKLTTFADQGAAGYETLSTFYVQRQEFDKAVAALEEGRQAYPAHVPLQRALMRLLLQRNRGQDRQRALGILAALEQQLPQDPELMKTRAFCLLDEATPAALAVAREKLESVVRVEPTAVDAQLVLIGMAMREGNCEGGRDLAIRALGSNPDQPALLVARGGAELTLQNPRLAIELARLALQKDPNYLEASVLLGQAELALQHTPVAIELARPALQKDPNHVGALVLLAQAGLTSNDRSALDEARTRLDTYCGTEAGAHSVIALVTLADLYRLTGDPEKAGQRIQQAEKLDPRNLTVIHARFLWLVAQKRYAELAALSPAYLSARKHESEVVMRAASVLSSLDSTELKQAAVRLCEHAVALSPAAVGPRLGLASGLYQAGNAECAETIYRQLLEQYPDDRRVLNDLAWILQEHSRRYGEALALAERGVRLAPDDLHLLDTRGTILMNMPDRLTEAKRDFERIVVLAAPDLGRQAKAHLQLARVCIKLNDPEEARKHAEIALKTDESVSVLAAGERTELAGLMRAR